MTDFNDVPLGLKLRVAITGLLRNLSGKHNTKAFVPSFTEHLICSVSAVGTNSATTSNDLKYRESANT